MHTVVNRICLRERMVNNVEFDDVVEKMLADPGEFTVYRGRGALQQSPRAVSVLGKRRMGVVEVCDGQDPLIEPQPGLKVDWRDCGEAKNVTSPPKTERHHANADVK